MFLKIAADALSGENIKESANTRLNEAKKELASVIRTTAKKRKHNPKVKKHSLKKRKKNQSFNIFDDGE